MWLLITLFAIAFWLTGDFGYSCYVRNEIRKWESQISRDAHGVRDGCQAYTIGTGPVGILLIHGFNETPHVWHKMAPSLASKGYTVRAIRLPGFGETIDRYAASTPDAWRDEVADEISSLNDRHECVVVVAHSLGGALTIDYFLQQSNGADGIILLAPAIEISRQRSPVFGPRFWHRFASMLLPFSRVSRSPFTYDAKDPDERAILLRNKFSPRQVIENTFQILDKNRGRARELTIPARIVVASDDQVVDSSAIRRFFEQLGSGDKLLIEATNSGHAIPVDFDWPMVVETIDEFARHLK